ncbi:MAG TPA: SDR family NAD(P)-dependent oxidoreductase [Acidimicrobiales bacterium]
MTPVHYERLEGKVVLVTGGSRGIGRGIALAFAQQGALVMVNSRSHEGAMAVVDEIGAAGGIAEAVVADVGDALAARALIGDIVGRHNRLDVLVNSAAIGPVVPLLEMTVQKWEEVQRVNLWALFHCGQPAAKQMIAQGGGSIVVIGSPGAIEAYEAQVPYCTSKAGLQMLAMGMAWEWGPLGVRTNVVQPGWIETSLNRRYLADQDVRERVVMQIPLGKLGASDDVARATLWLCSDDASYVNGATIQVDGGLISGRPTVVSKRFEGLRQ